MVPVTVRVEAMRISLQKENVLRVALAITPALEDVEAMQIRQRKESDLRAA